MAVLIGFPIDIRYPETTIKQKVKSTTLKPYSYGTSDGHSFMNDVIVPAQNESCPTRIEVSDNLISLYVAFVIIWEIYLWLTNYEDANADDDGFSYMARA